MSNIDEKTVEGFGEEWHRFDHSVVDASEFEEIFNQYFSIFPWDSLPQNALGFDLGCGTGRWAKYVANQERVGHLHCIDPSSALEVAKEHLQEASNVSFHHAAVNDMPIEDSSMDFGYSLGVLHHIPDTKAGIRNCVEKLKPGAPFLLYLYYSLDNRPEWFQKVWGLSNQIRGLVSELPQKPKNVVSDAIAVGVYWPLARFSKALSSMGINTSNLPLSAYKDRSLYCMRTDSLDRFGTRLEHRFSKDEIYEMMMGAGLRDISFSDSEPFWCALGYRDQ